MFGVDVVDDGAVVSDLGAKPADPTKRATCCPVERDSGPLPPRTRPVVAARVEDARVRPVDTPDSVVGGADVPSRASEGDLLGSRVVRIVSSVVVADATD